jgi:hypothetical protein
MRLSCEDRNGELDAVQNGPQPMSENYAIAGSTATHVFAAISGAFGGLRNVRRTLSVRSEASLRYPGALLHS